MGEADKDSHHTIYSYCRQSIMLIASLVMETFGLTIVTSLPVVSFLNIYYVVDSDSIELPYTRLCSIILYTWYSLLRELNT